MRETVLSGYLRTSATASGVTWALMDSTTFAQFGTTAFAFKKDERIVFFQILPFLAVPVTYPDWLVRIHSGIVRHALMHVPISRRLERARFRKDLNKIVEQNRVACKPALKLR